MKTLLSYLLVISLTYVLVYCACPPDGVTTFTIVPPEQYDMNYTDIAVDGRRPLGFMKGIYYYNDPLQNNPCIKLENTANKRLEIKVETIPEARICVKTDKPNEPSLCGQGKISQCRQTTADEDEDTTDDTLYFEFHCDGECSESDVTFWYRFALSPNASVIDPELWCDNRDNNEYPSSLQGFIPGNANPKPAPTDNDINGSVSLFMSYTWSLVFMILIINIFN